MQKLCSSLITLHLFMLVACASSPNLDSYPERQIDRPFTIPDDVATWTTNFGATQVDDGTNSVEGYIFPLAWQQALSDNWTLVYAPIPLAARYQAYNDGKNFVGLQFGTGFGYSSFSGLILLPNINIYHRINLNRTYAIQSSIEYETRITETTTDQLNSISLRSGPLFQLDDNKALSLFLGLHLTRNELAFLDEFDDSTLDDDFAVLIPAGFNFRWLLHRQWEYSVGYSVSSLSNPEDRLTIHRLDSSITLFW